MHAFAKQINDFEQSNLQDMENIYKQYILLQNYFVFFKTADPQKILEIFKQSDLEKLEQSDLKIFKQSNYFSELSEKLKTAILQFAIEFKYDSIKRLASIKIFKQSNSNLFFLLSKRILFHMFKCSF